LIHNEETETINNVQKKINKGAKLVAIKDIIEAFLKEDMPDASGKNVEDLLD
jgi:hypothetical protein